jgi:RNA polymerase sigma-B factor
MASDTTQITRDRLIQDHLPLVQSVARRFAGRGETLEDLIQVGAVGLIKASDRFDESRGVAFASFAAPAIEGEIRRHLRDRSSVLRIPRKLQRASGELRKQRGQLAATLGHSPTVGEIAAALDTDEEQIERALKAELAREAVPLSADGDTAELALNSDQQSGSEDRLSLASSVRALDERERAIVFLRFHLDMTERQIARKLGISQAHVSRLLTGALSQLRADLASSKDANGDGDITAGEAPSPGGAPSTAPGEVPSATLPSAPLDEKTRAGGQAAARAHQRAAKIGRVRASQENRTVAHYLELPYTVAVKSERDGEQTGWSATIEELAGCKARGDSPDEAVDRLRPVMEAWLEAALAEGREIPVPAAKAAKQRTSSSHSGRFLVRMSGTLHGQLARAAEGEHLSLNRFVTKVLASSVSPARPGKPQTGTQGREQTTEPAQSSNHNRSRGLRIALATNLALVVFAGLAAIVLLVLALQNGF